MSRLRSGVIPAAGSTPLRRFIIGCAAAALVLTGGALATSTAVQATAPPTDAPAEGHPIVGAWIYHVDGFPEQFTSVAAFHADGTYQDTGADGASSIGSWEATGPDSFDLTFVWLSLTEEGSVTMFKIRAAGEVSEDRQGWTADYTLELTGEGAPPGEYGVGTATATRINVEPIGTPAAPIEALFPDLFPPGGSAPAGSEIIGPSDAGVATTTG
jgi:hypothetical protein